MVGKELPVTSILNQAKKVTQGDRLNNVPKIEAFPGQILARTNQCWFYDIAPEYNMQLVMFPYSDIYS